MSVRPNGESHLLLLLTLAHRAYGGHIELEVDILGERELSCNDDKYEGQFTRWTMKSDHGR